MKVSITDVHDSHGITFQLNLETENLKDVEAMTKLHKCLARVDEESKLYVFEIKGSPT